MQLDLFSVVAGSIGYLLCGMGCVIHRAESGTTRTSDGLAMVILVLWPLWALAFFLTSVGWRKR